MPVVIPFQPSIGRYKFTITINGRAYLFRVYWNDRDVAPPVPGGTVSRGAWYFNVYDLGADAGTTGSPGSSDASQPTPVIIGVKIVRGIYLGRQAQHPLFQEGVMIARGLVPGDPSEADLDTIGSRVQVRYYTLAEMINEMLAQATSEISQQQTSGDSS
jgi:hypothetical protein